MMRHLPERVERDDTIEEKIRKAWDLLVEWGERLRADEVVAGLLQHLTLDLADSRRTMQELQVIATCKTCEEQEGGSCCGAGIENRYGVVLLLLNLLLEGSLAEAGQVPGSCYFLGKSGCVLPVRQVICVNYLCAKVRNRLLTEELIQLQTVCGAELDTVFRLHEAVKRVITR